MTHQINQAALELLAELHSTSNHILHAGARHETLDYLIEHHSTAIPHSLYRGVSHEERSAILAGHPTNKYLTFSENHEVASQNGRYVLTLYPHHGMNALCWHRLGTDAIKATCNAKEAAYHCKRLDEEREWILPFALMFRPRDIRGGILVK